MAATGCRRPTRRCSPSPGRGRGGRVAAGAFTFMLCWNEFIVAQVLNTKPGTTTLPPVIAGMNGQINIDYSVIPASGFLGALPAVLLVLIFQKYMVQGLTAGSVKG